MTTARDTHNQIEYAKEIAHEEGLEEGLAKGRVKGRAEGLEEGLSKGRAEGREKGREEGREEGRADAKQQIAINFLQLGTPCEIVAKATGLSLEEVTKLKEQEPATR